MNDPFTVAFFCVLSAHVQSLQALIEAALKSSGLHQLEGVDIPRWITERQRAELEKTLISLENANPAAAALVQKTIDDLKKKIEGGGSI